MIIIMNCGKVVSLLLFLLLFTLAVSTQAQSSSCEGCKDNGCTCEGANGFGCDQSMCTTVNPQCDAGGVRKKVGILILLIKLHVCIILNSHLCFSSYMPHMINEFVHTIN